MKRSFVTMRPPPEFPELAEVPTRAYYENHAAEYARATQQVDLSPLWSTLERALPVGALIGDLGCGAGRDLTRFGRSSLAPIGLDRSLGLGRIASQHSGRPVVVGDVRVLPFRDGAFDAVWCVATLLHLSAPDALEALVEVRRVLRKAGVAVVTLKEDAGRVDEKRADRWFVERFDELGRRTVYYSEPAARALFREAGFKELELLRSVEERARQSISWLAFLAR